MPGGCPGVRTALGNVAQDAGLFGAIRVPAKGPTAPAQTRALSPASSTRSWEKGSQRPQEAATHREAHLRAAQGRVRVWRRIHQGQGIREGAPPPVAGDVRAALPRAGQCQCDFGEALVVIGGVEHKAHYFILDLPTAQDALSRPTRRRPPRRSWMATFQRLRSWAGAPEHPVRQYQSGGGRILGDGRRKRTRAFTELQSHYLFDDRFGRPARGNDKRQGRGHGGLRAPELPGAHLRPSRALLP